MNSRTGCFHRVLFSFVCRSHLCWRCLNNSPILAPVLWVMNTDVVFWSVSAEKRILKSFNAGEAPFPAVCGDICDIWWVAFQLGVRNCWYKKIQNSHFDITKMICIGRLFIFSNTNVSMNLILVSTEIRTFTTLQFTFCFFVIF